MAAPLQPIDEALLDAKLAELEQARAWSPRLVTQLAAVLRSPDPERVVRMNPLTFAREQGVTAHEAIDLFLHATHFGLVTMDWHLLCPNCGAAVESFASLRSLHRAFFCAVCTLRSDANLDDYIAISFTVAPRIRPLAAHDPSTLSPEDFLRLRYTREAHLGSLDGPLMRDVLVSLLKMALWLEPGERRQVDIEIAGGRCAAAEFQAHTGVHLRLGGADAPGEVTFTIDETAMVALTEAIRPGRVTVSVENRRPSRVVWCLANLPDMAPGVEPGDTPKAVLEPVLSGARLLTHQTFRRLFRGETIQGSEGIGVREVTILFTDLKSSTALYQRIGDLKAFTLVQQHFERLTAVVAAHAGAVIKTIGDAVMAAFLRPADAVRAALAMQEQIDRFNHEHGGRDIILKIGVHRGPSIAVTLNHALDYFGHTVNVAARVQGLADADEIYVTDEVYRADGVAALLAHVETQDAKLRGVQQDVRVHKAVRTTS